MAKTDDKLSQSFSVPPVIGGRSSRVLKGIVVLGLVIGLAALSRILPVRELIASLMDWVQGLGVWGPVVYGLIYVTAVLLLVPASPLTVAAGALFGLVVGTATASLASTTGAALAFLIARHGARDAVAHAIRGDRRFAAIDHAIAKSGWIIVALLRLSPAVPFSLQNYLYGLTGIRFWTCLLTSWLAMLPGTLLYVYLGHAGRIGLDAVLCGTTQRRTPAEWVLLAVGLAATLAVTIFVTRLARRAIHGQSPSLEPLEEAKSQAPGGT